MAPILYKELLAAKPQLAAVLALGMVLFVGEMLSVDGLRGVAGILTTNIEGLLLLIGGLAFALGHAQIGPEIAHKHVELLDALPLNRTQVFMAKLVAGLMTMVLLLLVTASSIVATVQLTWGEWAPQTVAVVFGAVGVGLFSFYATGLLLSWIGGFGWALLGLGITVISTIAEISASLRPMSLFHGFGTVRFEANEPIVVLWPLGFWGLYGLGCIALSGLLFIGRGDRLIDAGSSLAQIAKVGVISLVGGLLLLMGTITGARLGLRGSDASARPALVDAGSFRVLVPQQTSTTAQALIDQMPIIDADIRALLGAVEPLVLDVELAGGGKFHAGQYTGGKIRMALGDSADEIFAHELTHAYADKLSAQRMRKHHNAMRFFNEGLAMWVAERVVSSKTETDTHRAWAGALYTLNHHPIDLLMDDASRALRYDQFEPYPLGLTFVEALVDAHGVPSLPCVLRAAAELPKSRQVAGVAIWARFAEQCKLNFTRIDDAYEARLRRYAEKWPVPETELLGQPAWRGGELLIVLPRGPLNGPRRKCRFRSRLAASAADIDQDDVQPVSSYCRVRSIISATNTVSYQVGVDLPDGWTAFTRWIEQPVPPRRRSQKQRLLPPDPKPTMGPEPQKILPPTELPENPTDRSEPALEIE